jgi:hypothetical protein
MRKNFNLSDEEFIICMSYILQQKNNYISELKIALKNNAQECLTEYYQREIDKINDFEDRLSLKFKIKLFEG